MNGRGGKGDGRVKGQGREKVHGGKRRKAIERLFRVNSRQCRMLKEDAVLM